MKSVLALKNGWETIINEDSIQRIFFSQDEESGTCIFVETESGEYQISEDELRRIVLPGHADSFLRAYEEARQLWD